jgi:hypothetical protein
LSAPRRYGKTQALIYDGDVARIDGRLVIVDPLLERWLQRTQR